MRTGATSRPSRAAQEAIDIIADRWLSGLQDLEDRAQAMIQQLGRMIELLLRPLG